MLQAKLYNNEEYVGDYNVEIEFSIEDKISYVNIELDDILRNNRIEKIIDTLFIKNQNILSIEVILSSSLVLQTNNFYIRNISRGVDRFTIEGFSTDYGIITKQIKKKMYEKIIEDIEEDDYCLYNITVKEFDQYRLIELAYAKDEDE